MGYRVAAAALLSAAALLGACGGDEPGTPVASPSEESRPAPGSSSAPVTSEASPRPSSLDLAAADPCLVTPEQSGAWGVSGEPRRSTVRGGTILDGSPTCAYLATEQQAGFLISTSAEVGVDEFLDTVQATPLDDGAVDGFPAVSIEGVASRPETGSGECYVMVDVADDQMLSVQFSQIAASADKRLPIETLCAKAREVASAAVTTLQGG